MILHPWVIGVHGPPLSDLPKKKETFELSSAKTHLIPPLPWPSYATLLAPFSPACSRPAPGVPLNLSSIVNFK